MGANTATYFKYYEMPLFIFLTTVLWVVIGVRLAVFRRRFPGWKTYRGVSMIMILIAGTLCTVYVFMLLSVLLWNLRVERFKHGVISGSDQARREKTAADFSDAEADETISILKKLDIICTLERIVLFLTLYVVKFAFFIIFMETRSQVSARVRGFLYFTAGFMFLTVVTLLYMMIQEWITTDWNGFLYTTREDVRNNMTQEWSMNFEVHVEMTNAVLNIISDGLLVFVAYKTVRAFPQVPPRAAILPCAIVIITIAIAIARIPMIMLDYKEPNYATAFIIPFELLWEFETFLATMLACIPGLKVYVTDAMAKPREDFAFGQNRADLMAEIEKGGISASVTTPGELLMPEELEARAKLQRISSSSASGEGASTVSEKRAQKSPGIH